MHGNSPHQAIKENQAHAYGLRVFKRLVSEQHATVKMEWVPSHQDDLKTWDQCTLKEKINIKVDRLAKASFIAAVADIVYIKIGFPGEHITIIADGRKVTGSLKKAFTQSWGSRAAQAFYHDESIIASQHFNLIWWDEVGAVMHRYPTLFNNWVTK